MYVVTTMVTFELLWHTWEGRAARANVAGRPAIRAFLYNRDGQLDELRWPLLRPVEGTVR